MNALSQETAKKLPRTALALAVILPILKLDSRICFESV